MDTILRIGACRDCVRSDGTMDIPVPLKDYRGYLGFRVYGLKAINLATPELPSSEFSV